MANPDENQNNPSDAVDGTNEPKDMQLKSKDDMQQRLGLGLKNMYSSVLDEPLPDDMLALLDQLADDDGDENGSDISKSDAHE